MNPARLGLCWRRAVVGFCGQHLRACQGLSRGPPSVGTGPACPRGERCVSPGCWVPCGVDVGRGANTQTDRKVSVRLTWGVTIGVFAVAGWLVFSVTGRKRRSSPAVPAESSLPCGVLLGLPRELGSLVLGARTFGVRCPPGRAAPSSVGRPPLSDVTLSGGSGVYTAGFSPSLFFSLFLSSCLNWVETPKSGLVPFFLQRFYLFT